MADKDRRIASMCFVGGLLGTLFSAIVLGSQLLVVLFLIIQIPAYIWYCASYIPFARDCIKSCLSSCLKKASPQKWSHWTLQIYSKTSYLNLLEKTPYLVIFNPLLLHSLHYLLLFGNGVYRDHLSIRTQESCQFPLLQCYCLPIWD